MDIGRRRELWLRWGGVTGARRVRPCSPRYCSYQLVIFHRKSESSSYIPSCHPWTLVMTLLWWIMIRRYLLPLAQYLNVTTSQWQPPTLFHHPQSSLSSIIQSPALFHHPWSLQPSSTSEVPVLFHHPRTTVPDLVTKTDLLTGLIVGKQGWKCPVTLKVTLLATCCGKKIKTPLSTNL